MTEKPAILRVEIARELVRLNLGGERKVINIVDHPTNGRKNGEVKSLMRLSRITDPGERFTRTDLGRVDGVQRIYYRRQHGSVEPADEI